jgi:hypothetical protein
MVAVIGGYECTPAVARTAREAGKFIAREGWILVCGGMGGVMEAACRGAREAGGVTVGILPGKSKSEANPFITIPIVTAMSHARNAIIVRTADAVLAIAGKFGTLSEIGLARAIDKPVFGIKTWDIEGVVGVKDPAEAVRKIKEALCAR